MSWYHTAPSAKSEVADIDEADHMFTGLARGISFAEAGDLVVIRADGSEDTIPEGALAAGLIHPVECIGIKREGTDATTIVGHF